MSATCTHAPASATTLPELPRDVELGRLFADLAAELTRAVDPDAVTAAVASLTTVALRLGARESWLGWDSWSSRSGTTSAPTDSAGTFTMFGIRKEQPGPRWQAPLRRGLAGVPGVVPPGRRRCSNTCIYWLSWSCSDRPVAAGFSSIRETKPL